MVHTEQWFLGAGAQHVVQVGTVEPVRDQGGLYQSGSSGGESGCFWNMFCSRTNKDLFLGWIGLGYY